jgi:uncharacterized protein YkwD
MLNTRNAGTRRVVATAGGLAALGVAAVVSLAPAAGGASRDAVAERGAPCSAAAAPVADSSVRELRRSIRCLINQERGVRGLGRVVRNHPLQKAAQRHTKTMVATGCLAHRCPDEADLETRLRRAGYFDGAESWRYAENTGCGESAEAMYANWMATVYHRVNILDPDFDDVGVGVSTDRVPGRCKKDYGTFTLVLGTRETP